MQNTYESDLSESAWKPSLKVTILNFEKGKKFSNLWRRISTFPTFQTFFGEGAWDVPQKKAWHDRDMTFWKDISQNLYS